MPKCKNCYYKERAKKEVDLLKLDNGDSVCGQCESEFDLKPFIPEYCPFCGVKFKEEKEVY